MAAAGTRRRSLTRRRFPTAVIAYIATMGIVTGCGLTTTWGPSVPVGSTVPATVDNVWMGDGDKGTSVGPDPTFASNGVYGKGSARFTVIVDSIRCASNRCEVELRVRNEEAVPAQYRCEQTEATDSEGNRYGTSVVGFGGTRTGCDPSTMHRPHVWESVQVTLFYVLRTLRKLQIPGDGSIDLPSAPTS